MLKELLPPHVMIIDSGVAVARQTFSILQQANLLSARDTRGKHQFYTNTNTEVLNHFLKEVEFQVDVAYLDF
jgi:glutamate racemase